MTEAAPRLRHLRVGQVVGTSCVRFVVSRTSGDDGHEWGIWGRVVAGLHLDGQWYPFEGKLEHGLFKSGLWELVEA